MNHRLYAFGLVTALAVGLLAGGCGSSDDQPATVVEGDDEDLNVDEQNGDESDGDSSTGAACQEDRECASDLCLTGEDWPGGHCSTVGCSEDSECHDGICLQDPQGNNYCANSCAVGVDADQCRDGYTCLPAPEAQRGWCGPEPDDPDTNDDEDDGSLDEYDVDIECQSVSGVEAQFEYEISEEAESYMVVPLSANGEPMAPEGIETPGGTYIDFEGTNSFQTTGAQMFGVINPTLVPATPGLADQFETGTHTYHLRTEDDEVCHYVLEDSEAPARLDLNVYLVGLDGISAESAATNVNLQTVFDEAEAIYEQAGVELGTIRYFGVPDEAVQNYSVIRSRADVSELVAYSQSPGTTTEEVVSANVFITEQFAFSDGSGVQGLSLGIPGAAGFHGSGLSGVVMTGEQIGQADGGNKFTANVLAHEVGHFLGLFHTSERSGDTLDPLGDTPECDDLTNDIRDCPDWGNLMFPVASGDNDGLTDGQSHVLSVNPLTR